MPDGDLASRLAASREKLAARKNSNSETSSGGGDESGISIKQPASPSPSSLAEKPRSRKAQRIARAEKAPDTQQSMPHSVEAEQGVLGSILVDSQRGSTRAIVESSSKITPDYFYVPAHKTIYEVMIALWGAGVAIDFISFTQILRDRGMLDTIGGVAFITALFTFVPTAANIEHYLDIVSDKFMRREALAVHTRSVRALYGNNEDDANFLIDRATFRLSRVKQSYNGAHELLAAKLIEMKDQSDPNTLVGFRWLVRGGNSLWAGGAGYGKSSLVMQIGIYWACGQPIFAIRPVRPLKNLIVQAENDDFDVSEQFNGVLAGIQELGDVEALDQEKISKNLIVARVDGMSGTTFIAELEFLLTRHHPDIVWIDPLFAFAGCDLIDSVAIGKFLREGMFPLFVKYHCCGNVVHHVGKPARAQNGHDTIASIDEQYLSFGSSEIQNAFRAINVLKPPTKDAPGVFRLVLSKRGQRAGAKDPEGEFTHEIFLKQSFPHICWTQVAEPEKPTVKGRQSRFNEDHVLMHMSVAVPMKVKDLLRLVRDPERGKMSDSTFFRIWDELQLAQKVKHVDDGWVIHSHNSHELSE